MTTIVPKITILDETLAELTARLQQALERADRLEKSLTRVARGTIPQAIAEGAAPPIETMKRRIADPDRRPSAMLVEKALRLKPCDTATLAGRLELPVSPTLNMVRVLQREGKVVNIGTVARPLWFWVIGDETSTPELAAAVEQLIRLRPMSHQEIAAATGARANRISGVIAKMQRRLPITNRGTGNRGLWHLS